MKVHCITSVAGYIFYTMRDNSLDTVGGIMVLYMIFGHCCPPELLDYDFRRFLMLTLYCFMPWFFFKSGMFHRDSLNVKETWKRTFPKLARPYIVFSILGFLFLFLENWLKGKDLIHFTLSQARVTLFHSANSGAVHLWFLVTLLLVKSIYPFMLRKIKYGGVGNLWFYRLGFVLCK